MTRNKIENRNVVECLYTVGRIFIETDCVVLVSSATGDTNQGDLPRLSAMVSISAFGHLVVDVVAIDSIRSLIWIMACNDH